VSGVYQWRSMPSTQLAPGPSATDVPGETRPRYSAGISPSSHTDRASSGLLPMPWMSTHTATFAPIRNIVMTGVPRVGLSSR